MSYIKLNNGVAEQYSFTQLRQDNPYEADPIPADATLDASDFGS